MPALFLPPFTKITYLVISLGSLLFLVSGIKDCKSKKNRRGALIIIAGIIGLLYIGLGVYWYDHVGPWHSRAIAIALYAAIHFTAGVAIGLLLYVSRLCSTKFMVAISSVSLIVANTLAVMRRPAVRVLYLEEGLFAGLFMVSLALFWLDRGQEPPKSANIEA